MAVTKFDRGLCAALDKEILEAVRSVADRHGLTISPCGGTYDDTRWTTKIEFAVTHTADGKTIEEAEFLKHCELYDCAPSDYGRTLIINRDHYTLIGFALSRSKFPVRVRNVKTGKVHLFRETVLGALRQIEPTTTTVA